MGALPNVFGATNRRSKYTESRSETWIRFGAAVREFCDDRCMFIEQRGQSLVVGRQKGIQTFWWVADKRG